MEKMNIDFKKTALVLIDLQKGIVASHGGGEVVEKATELVELFHQNQGFIVFVNVAFHDGKDILKPITDKPALSQKMPDDWAELDPRLDIRKSDYRLTKRQWGAFFGTDLDLQLRRRGMDTIVLCGISTNRGVESTAREAYQFGYNQIFVEDAMKAHSEEEHQASVRFVFPQIGRIRRTADLIGQTNQ